MMDLKPYVLSGLGHWFFAKNGGLYLHRRPVLDLDYVGLRYQVLTSLTMTVSITATLLSNLLSRFHLRLPRRPVEIGSSGFIEHPRMQCSNTIAPTFFPDALEGLSSYLLISDRSIIQRPACCNPYQAGRFGQYCVW